MTCRSGSASRPARTVSGWSALGLGLAVIGALAVAVIVTTGLFWKVRPLAGALLLPYLAWVLFAALLNWQFLAANPAADGQDAGGAVSRVAI